MEGGIEPSELGDLTFREVDLKLQRQKWLVENDWEQTRLIVAALTHKRPKEIVRLSRDQSNRKEWTDEEARNVLKSYGEWQR